MSEKMQAGVLVDLMLPQGRSPVHAAVMSAFVFVLSLPCTLRAQDYPSKPVRIIVSTGAGGSADTLTRVLAQKLGERLHQQFVVENRAGAGGVIGTDMVSKAPADGYTLLSAYGSHVINATLYTKLPYDTIKDFSPITQIAQQPLIAVVHPSVPIQTAKDLIALARARPTAILYASAGSGSGGHIATEMLATATGTKMTHVPFKEAAAALVSVVSGQTHVMLPGLVNAIPHVRSGRLRAIGVTSGKRSHAAPDIPTLAEALQVEYEAVVGYFLLAPARTPKIIIDRLHADVAEALGSPDLIARYQRDGAEPLPRNPAGTAKYIEAEIQRLGKVIKDMAIRAD